MQKTANFIGLIKAAARPKRPLTPQEQAQQANQTLQAFYANPYDQKTFQREYGARMKSGMGYSGRDVLDQMAGEIAKKTGVPVERVMAQLTPLANQANMIHNSNVLGKFQEANADNQQYVNDTLGQDFDQLSRTVPGLWGINQDARQTANFAANEGRGAAMRRSATPAKGMTGRGIMAKREAYNQEKARRKQQPATQGKAQGFNGGAYLDKITADANARINGGDVDWKNPPAMQAYDNARINGTQSHATSFPAGIQDLRTSGASPVQPPQVTAPAPAPTTATTATGSTPAQAPTVTGYGNKQGMDAWKDAERKRLKGKYSPGKIEAALTNDAYRKSNGGRNYVDMSRYRPLNAQ